MIGNWIAQTVRGLIFLPIFVMATHSASAATIIEDASGRTVRLDTVPQRIVVVGAAPFIPLHMLYLFEEAKTRLVGYEAKVKKPDEFLQLLDSQYSSKTALATNPGPESVAALAPDLVITKATSTPTLAKSLARLGIPTICLGAENPELFFKDIQVLGQVFGNPERANQIISFYDEQIAFINRVTGDVAPEKKRKVLMTEYSNRGKLITLNVPASTWFQTRQVIMAAGNPVWQDRLSAQEGWQLTGFEQIAAWDPEMIFLVVWYRLKGPQVMAQLYSDSKWLHLNAVQNRRLYLFPKDVFGWDAATPRWILGTLWLTSKMYPHRFASTGVSLDDKIRRFFKTLYFMDENTVQTQMVPRINQHAFQP